MHCTLFGSSALKSCSGEVISSSKRFTIAKDNKDNESMLAWCNVGSDEEIENS